MVNGKIEGSKEIYLNCTLTLNDHTFPINLVPITIGSFVIIVGMEWLDPHHADIIFYEKVVPLNLPNSEPL